MKLSSNDEAALIKLSEDKKIFLEGNILKILISDDYQFLEYLDFAQRKDKDNQSIDTALLGNTWSSLLGILLTNSFSIIGTIMGVKYASESNKIPES